MTITEDQVKTLHAFGFKRRGKKAFDFNSFYYQTISINVLESSLQLVVDGQRIYGTELSFDDVLKIITILYPDETRKRIRAVNSEYVKKLGT